MFVDVLAVVWRVLVLMAGAAVLGFALAWVLRQRTIDAIRTRAKSKVNPFVGQDLSNIQSELASLRVENEKLKKEVNTFQAAKEADEALQKEILTLRTRKVELEAELQQIHQTSASKDVLEARVDELLAAQTAHEATIQRMETEQEVLQEQLIEALKKAPSPEMEKATKHLQRQIAKLEKQVKGLQKENEARVRAYAELQNEQDQLRTQLVTAKSSLLRPSRPTNAEKERAAMIRRIASRKGQINWDEIGRAPTGERDNLKRIDGVDAFTERKLNALDIYTFKQIAHFSEDNVELINSILELVPGRIVAENWIMQCRRFIGLVPDDEDTNVVAHI